jgi:hypothetical protein
VAIAAIENDSEVLSQSDGKVELDLRPVIEQVVADVAGETDTDITVPADIGRIELFTDEGLSKVQDAANLLRTLAWVLSAVALIAFAAAIVIARGSRWRAVMQVGFGVILVALISAAILRFAREETVSQVADRDLSEAAVGAICDTLVRDLESQNWFLLLIGTLAVALGAVMGDYDWARSLRAALAERTGESGAPGALQRFARERPALTRGIGVAGGVALLLSGPIPASSRCWSSWPSPSST